MGSLVDAGAIPYTNVDVGAIRAGASSLGSAAGEVRSGGAAVVSAWRPIAGVYRGPGDAQLFSAMDPVGASSTAFGDDLEKVAGALRSFADQVEPVVARLKALHADALALGGKVAAFKPHETWSWMALGDVKVDSWDQDESLNNENNRIINGVADQMVEYEAAERTCANTIRSIAGLPPLHALTGASDDPLGYGYSSIPAGTKLPWGQSADRQESCSEKTATFVPGLVKGVLWDGLGGALHGIVQLAGFAGPDGTFWSAKTFETTWGGVFSLVSWNPQTKEWGDWSGAGEAWTELGKSTIAWDQWAKEPGTALGSTAFNIASLFVGVGAVAKIGAVGRAGEAASAASKLSKLAAIGDLTDPVSLVGKGAHLASPKLSELASVLGGKLDSFKGLVSDHMPSFKDGAFHFDVSHAEPEVPVARAEQIAPHVDQPIAEPAEAARAHAESMQTDQAAPAKVNEQSAHLDTSHVSETGSANHAISNSHSGHEGRAGDEAGSTAVAESGGHPPERGTDAANRVRAGDLVDSGEKSGPGWSRTSIEDELKASTDARPNLEPGDGRVYENHGDSGDYPMGSTNDAAVATTRTLIEDPLAPYGRDPDSGLPFTKEQYDERFVTPDGMNRYPLYDGVVPGTRLTFTDPQAFVNHFGTHIDRIGSRFGAYFALEEYGRPASFEARSLPIDSLNKPYEAYSLTSNAIQEMGMDGVKIEISRVGPGAGRTGGALQVRFLKASHELSVNDLIDEGWLG